MMKAGKLTRVLMAVSLAAVFLFSINSFAFAEPWADEYGFDYPDGMTSHSSVSLYGYRHSGIEHYWDPTPGGTIDPSTHKSLCNGGWPATSYYQSDIENPYLYLNGNAMFVFYGHSGKHLMEFYNPAWPDDWHKRSYIRSTPQPGDTNWTLYIVDGYYSIGDMAFAALIGCKTSEGENGMAYYWRCVKGVDTVIGFDADLSYQPGSCFNENFFYWAVCQGFSPYEARSMAVGAVKTQIKDKGYPNGYGGANTCDIWGSTSQSISYPHFGDPNY